MKSLSTVLLVLVAVVAVVSCGDDDPGVQVDPPEAPFVRTEPASGVGTTAAQLHARVAPGGAPTTVYFDVELSKAPTDSVGVGAGRDSVDVQVDVDDLQPGSVYEYRAVAFNSVGTAEGATESFLTQTPNQPPSTQVVATPPDLGETAVEVSFFWHGSDPDGEIVGYEWRLSDNGPDGNIDVADTLGLAWGYTTVTDTLFEVSADLPMFAGDPALFWQPHTFFVRAVDDRDARDPTPAAVSFTATTAPPTVQITSHGGASTTCIDVTGGTPVTWSGDDPDARNNSQVDVRWILIEAAPGAGGDCWSQAEYEAEDPFASVADDDPRWSGWVSLSLTPGTTLPTLPPGTAVLLAVQVRDAPGAVSLGREWNVEVLALRYP